MSWIRSEFWKMDWKSRMEFTPVPQKMGEFRSFSPQILMTVYLSFLFPPTVTGAHPQITHRHHRNHHTKVSNLLCCSPSHSHSRSEYNALWCDEAIRWGLRQFPSRFRRAYLPPSLRLAPARSALQFELNRMYLVSDFLCDQRSNISEILNLPEKAHIYGKNDGNPAISTRPVCRGS
jgi:hypothetical protein